MVYGHPVMRSGALAGLWLVHTVVHDYSYFPMFETGRKLEKKKNLDDSGIIFFAEDRGIPMSTREYTVEFLCSGKIQNTTTQCFS